MDPVPFTLLLLAGSVAAGFLGALTGLGGGVVIVPLLVMVFGVDMRYAIGASLIAVIATSSGSAAAYVRDGFTNVRIGVLLEVATVLGALTGAYLAGLVDTSVLALIFGGAVLWSAWGAIKPPKPHGPELEPDRIATRLKLDSSFPQKQPDGTKKDTFYRVRQVPGGMAIMYGAGVLSAMVGIGSGIVKVLAMDRVMRLPFKVSTTTSNFMIGVTAAASAGVYFHRGQIDPVMCAPVVLGALAGSLLGARVLPRVNVKWLRLLFATVITIAGVRFIIRGVEGLL